jgi:hypothetical protein
MNDPGSKKELELATTGAWIATEAPTSEDLAFLHAVLCQVGLPRSQADGRTFERTSGAASLLVSAGSLWDGRRWVEQPLPYGAMPRLMLAWISTYALRHQTRVVDVGSSPSEFVRMLGISTSGGRRGGFTMFQKQAKALAVCRLQLGYTVPGRAVTYDGTPIERFEAWLTRDDQQRVLWPGEIVLSEGYYQTLQSSAVPLDSRALSALKGSALALDLYMMLAHRLHRVGGNGVFVPWPTVKAQFGQEYRAARDFKRSFLEALRAVLAVYPQAKVKHVDGGVLLVASPPPIPRGSLGE